MRTRFLSFLGLICASFVLSLALPLGIAFAASATGQTPIVSFKTHTEIISYLKKIKTYANFSEIGAGVGDVNTVLPAVDGQNTYAVLQAKVPSNGLNQIFVQVSNMRMTGNKALFGTPVQLSTSANGNTSNPGVVAFTNATGNHLVYLIWESKNVTSKLHTIYFASSMDAGKNFNSYALTSASSANAVNATQPRITTDYHQYAYYTWIESNPCPNPVDPSKPCVTGPHHGAGHGGGW
jgi:hypothetical protein